MAELVDDVDVVDDGVTKENDDDDGTGVDGNDVSCNPFNGLHKLLLLPPSGDTSCQVPCVGVEGDGGPLISGEVGNEPVAVDIAGGRVFTGAPLDSPPRNDHRRSNAGGVVDAFVEEDGVGPIPLDIEDGGSIIAEEERMDDDAVGGSTDDAVAVGVDGTDDVRASGDSNVGTEIVTVTFTQSLVSIVIFVVTKL
jgi:hypothetical protein